MFIDAFGFSSYRSFGDELQLLGPCRKINLLAGQNNSGKSNVLTFIHKQFARVVQATKDKTRWQVDEIDRHIGGQGEFRFALGLVHGSERHQGLLAALPTAPREAKYFQAMLEAILNARALNSGNGISWIRYAAPRLGVQLEVDTSQIAAIRAEAPVHESQWEQFWMRLTSQRGGAIDHWIRDILAKLSPAEYLRGNLPETVLIPAIRKIGDAGTAPEDYGGSGIIDRLAQLQDPGLQRQAERRRFDEITKFVRRVLDDDTAVLNVPYERDAVLVRLRGRLLPLSNLGTGVHQVIILAVAATLLERRIVCIEEPEQHLHPLLQRKLLRYLAEHTSNQYFITTHSAHLLDTVNAAVFHVRHAERSSTIDAAATAAGKSAICADLGYRASDILQANCVIWVEGPSDRIYLRHWIKGRDRTLIEGIHYSIMFYGGRLLSHLSADDPELTQFISLRRLNRYISILIDSDRRTAQSPLNETKKRVRDEFAAGPGFAWITKGREIENYIPTAVLERAVKSVHLDASRLADTTTYAHALHYVSSRKRKVVDHVDKVKVARAVVKEDPDYSPLDLAKRMDELIRFIRAANDSP